MSALDDQARAKILQISTAEEPDSVSPALVSTAMDLLRQIGSANEQGLSQATAAIDGAIQTLAAKQGVLEANLAALGPKIGEVDVSIKSVDYAGAGTLSGAIKGENGAKASSSNFRYTTFIDISGYERVRFAGIIANVSNYPFGYAFYSEDNVASYVSGSNFDSDTSLSGHEEHEYDVAIPSNARYIRTSIYNSFRQSFYLVATKGKSISDRLDSADFAISALAVESSTCYVSPSGNDANAGTKAAPFLTFQHAIDAGFKNIVGADGDYSGQKIVINGKNDISIKCVPTGTRNTWLESNSRYGRIKFDNSVVVSVELDATTGLWKFTKTFDTASNWHKVFVTQELPIVRPNLRTTSYWAVLWEIGTNLSAHKRLVPVLSLADCQDTAGTFFYDGNNVFIHPNGTNLAGTTFRYLADESDFNFITVSNSTNIHLEGFDCMFGTMYLVYTNKCFGKNVIKNCDFGFSAYQGGVNPNRTDMDVISCNSFCGCSDGFAPTEFGTVNFYNCSGRWNGDDGVSHHNGTMGDIDGGLWEHNGKGGVTPANGSNVNVRNVCCLNNRFGLCLSSDTGIETDAVVLIENSVFKNNYQDLYIFNYNCVLADCEWDSTNIRKSNVQRISKRKNAEIAEANIKYVVCSSALSSADRNVNIDGYTQFAGGSIKVLMTNRTTAAECNFKVNSANSAPLYYEGARAGADNTWASGELVEVFFDGTNWQAFRLKNVVVDATPTENSANALRSGAAYAKFVEVDAHIAKLNDEVFDTIADITPYKISANRTVNSLGKKSTIDGFAYIGYGANGYNGFPVGAGSTITANEGYRFNYVVRPEDSDGNNQTNLELQQGVTGSVTISHAGYLFISVESINNDKETAITAEEARTLAANGIEVSLILNLSKIDELANRVSEIESNSTIGAEVHTDIKNLPWVFGNISTGGTYTYDRDSVVLDRYIGVKKGSTITCLSNVQMQVRMIIDGSASYRSYATGTWTAETDCRIRFGFKYANSAEFKNMAILDDTSCTLYLQQGINRYDRRKVVNLYGVPNAVYRGCHVDDTGLTEATVDYDAFISPWDALVTSSNGYLTKKDLGETYNGKHLYCYRLGISYDRPNSYKPIIFIVTNVHGHEKTSTLGAFYLMKDLIEHYAENPVLQWIRDNAIIKVIPACNIYGIIHNTRYNQNRVNINRNYAAFSWEDFDDTAGGMNNSKGEAPESEVETSIIVEELLSESSTTALAIDIHTNGRPIDTPNYGALLYTNWRGEYFGDYDYQMRNVSAAFHANMRGIFDDYGVGGSATDIYGSLRQQKTDPTFERWLFESTNIWGGTLEVPCGYATGIGNRLTPYSADTIKVSGEIIGNYIIQMLYGLSHGSV